MELKGGRKTKEDVINYHVGFTINKKINDYINKKDSLFKVYSLTPLDESLIKKFKKTIITSKTKNPNYKDIYKIM